MIVFTKASTIFSYQLCSTRVMTYIKHVVALKQTELVIDVEIGIILSILKGIGYYPTIVPKIRCLGMG